MTALPGWYLSGGASNSNPNNSLGGIMSSVGASASLFDDVTGDESAAGDVEFRCIYVKNIGDVSLQNAVLWIQTNTPDTDTDIAVGLAAEGLNATATAIANENTVPPSVVFTQPPNKAGGIAMGNIPVGQRYGVWIRRTVLAGAAAYNNDTFTLRVEGDTGA